jgi:hypothetical protein
MRHMMNERALSWTPVRRGKIYCSPGCGGDCTAAAHRTAGKSGHALAALLSEVFGGRWTFRVWENLGWHYEARSPNGCIKVSPSLSHYHALLGESRLGGRWSEPGTTPELAVRRVLATARREISAEASWLGMKLVKVNDG